MAKKEKTWRLLSTIYHRKEVTLSDLDQGDQQRLLCLVKQGKVVESRSGSWSGMKYYKLSPDVQRKKDNWYFPAGR